MAAEKGRSGAFFGETEKTGRGTAVNGTNGDLFPYT